jgi:hypothetical protein
MKTFLSPVIIIAGLFIFSADFIKPQSDPFRINETGPRTTQSNDVFINWIQDAGGGNYKSFQKVYRYKTDGILLPPDSIFVDTMFTETSKREDNKPAKNAYLDIASGRFNKSRFDNTVSIWRTAQTDQKIEIMISNFDTTGFFTNTTSFTLEVGEPLDAHEQIFVRTGDFDADSLDEFIVTYLDDTDSVIFCLYDVDSTLQSTQIKRTSIVKVVLGICARPVTNYVQTADLNGDAKDEIILFTLENEVQLDVPVNIRIYSLENNNIVAKGTTQTYVPKYPEPLWEFVMAAAKGQFDNDNSDELFFSVVNQCPSASEVVRSLCNYIIDVSGDLQTISFGPLRLDVSTLSNPWIYTPFSVAAGDLNDDGRDEAILTSWNDVLHIYKVSNDYYFEPKVTCVVAYGGANDYSQSSNFLKVGDINMDNKEDITYIKHVSSGGDGGFWIQTLTCPDADLTQITTIARMIRDEPQIAGYIPYAISIGDYDGYDFTIGIPTLFHEYGVVQPIVTLNAPPVHFDIFGGTIYDVNGCFNGGSCDFWALYKKETTTSVEVSTQVHKDWELSSGFKNEGQIQIAPLGVGVLYNYRLWAIGKVGEHFSKDSTSVSSISISVEVQAREDDRIYSTISDYDIWEYPIIHGIETCSRRSLFALVPKNVQATWYSSKSYFAQNSVPDHEVGNILSYYPYDTLSNNPNLSEVIRASYLSDRFSLDGSSSYEWNLTFTDFQQSGASTEKNLGFDAGVELGSIATNFKFDNKKMTTHKTSVKSLINLKVHLSSLNMAVGEVEYTVTPYAYWGKNDALIVDYAVEPLTADPGFPPTWWDDHYGNQPDPAFALPWRLDPEKGYTLGDPDKRFQTKDITFIPKKPEAGDTLTITARVRNFSFEPTSSPVSVSYYLNDPDSGGTPIVGVNGTNSIIINSVINPQERSVVDFKLVLPNGLPSYPRIYAVIDQGNAITEIHENNNKGFNVLGASSIVGVDDEHYYLPVKYMLFQSYPNPFNPVTTIRYAIPQDVRRDRQAVTLIVYDILGRKVETLVDEEKPAGAYEVKWNAEGLSSGVYLYQLKAGGFSQTKKMILIK